jgi:hypothetical protein
MNIIEWIVLLGGLAAIAWINWYFFLASPAGNRGKRSRTHHHT